MALRRICKRDEVPLWLKQRDDFLCFSPYLGPVPGLLDRHDVPHHLRSGYS